LNIAAKHTGLNSRAFCNCFHWIHAAFNLLANVVFYKLHYNWHASRSTNHDDLVDLLWSQKGPKGNVPEKGEGLRQEDADDGTVVGTANDAARLSAKAEAFRVLVKGIPVEYLPEEWRV
jgi:hypothetical protein